MILITGGAGFIGSNFIRTWIKYYQESIINVDLLAYNNFYNIESIITEQHIFIKQNITNFNAIKKIIYKYKPRAILHFAAQTHVDKSIINADDFIYTNVVGTYTLLKASLEYYNNYCSTQNFKFIHISTDEVFGSLRLKSQPFDENANYAPNNPYAASKASADHLVRSFFKTYNLPCIITHCSNNYGPYQLPEKLIPLIIYKAINNKSLPIYGDGLNIRDWLYVEDHCLALLSVLENGRVGQMYNIGANNERTNNQIVNTICIILDKLLPKNTSYAKQIEHVKDRLGHDRRYAVNSSKIKCQLNWCPKHNFDEALYKTIQWYLNNTKWLEQITKKN